MEEFQSRSRWYDETDQTMLTVLMADLKEGDKEQVIITHGESTFYCNEERKIFWMENGKKQLLPKSKGSSLTVSGFIC